LFFDFLFLKLQFMQIKIKYNSEILIVITVVRFSFSYSADIFEPFLLHGITLENQILWHFSVFTPNRTTLLLVLHYISIIVAKLLRNLLYNKSIVMEFERKRRYS